MQYKITYPLSAPICLNILWLFDHSNKAVCKFFVFLYNWCVTTVVCINLGKFLCDLFYDYFDSDIFRNIQMYKLIVLVITLILVFLVLEPEKLKVTVF